MLKENNVKKGFFEHEEFFALRGALSSYLKGFVTFAYKTGSVFNRYNIVSEEDLKLAAQKQESYLKSQIGTISGTVHQLDTKKEVINDR